MIADSLHFRLLCSSAGDPSLHSRLCLLLCVHLTMCDLSQTKVLSHLPPLLHQKAQAILDCLLSHVTYPRV